MLVVRNDFDARSAEVRVYMDFVRDIVDGTRTIEPPMPTADFEQFKKTIKANSLLLLYNLVESTLGNAVEAIFDDLRTNGVRFDECRTEVQCVILTNLRRHNVDKIHPKLTDLSLHVVTETFRKKQLFAGNVDARKVRTTAGEFGFVPPRNGRRLVDVKNARNALAHGEKSFSEVGRDYTSAELQVIASHVTGYLSSVITNIENYVSAREYLAASVPSVP